jgi:hypothetical protein
MSGYARGGYLMARTTPSPDVEEDDDEPTPGAADPAAEDEVKVDDPRQAHGRKAKLGMAFLHTPRKVEKKCRNNWAFYEAFQAFH